jgi:hypothetical protein
MYLSLVMVILFFTLNSWINFLYPTNRILNVHHGPSWPTRAKDDLKNSWKSGLGK